MTRRHCPALVRMVLPAILSMQAGGCFPLAQIQRDTLARERIDLDIGARARRVRAELSGLSVQLEEPTLEAALEPVRRELLAIEHLAETGVHRAQTAQVFWGTDPTRHTVAISTPDNPSAEDDRAVVEMAGLAVERHGRRWWRRAPQQIVDAVVRFSALVAKAIIVEVPRAIIPSWLWWSIGPVGLLVLVVLARYYWHRYVVVPRMQRQHDEARKRHDELLAQRDAVIDEYDDGIEQLPPKIRSYVGKGKPGLCAAHKIRNDRRKAESRAFEAAILGGLGAGPNDAALVRIAEENARLKEQKAEADQIGQALAEIAAVIDGGGRDPGPADPTPT